MLDGFQGRVLKSGYARTVYVDAEGRVVKRFHHPNPLQALRDRRRAAGERRALAALFAADLPVPRPLGVRRVRGGPGSPLGAWEIVMERIEGAVELAAVLDGRAPAPIPAGELAQRVGKLLAAGQRAGLDHPDLHPGNWLVDDAGRVWLIDFHKARIRRGRSRRHARELAHRDLLALVAYLRETLQPDARRRLIEGWARAAGRTDPSTGGIESLAREVEDAARPHRRAWVAHAQGRWTRESSRCVAHHGLGPSGETAFVRRAGDEAAGAELLAAVVARAGSGPGEEQLAIAGERALFVTSDAPARLAALWYHAARLFEHAVPALAPAATCGRCAAFTLPPGAAPAPLATLSAATAGALLGTLHDRGLDVPSLDGLVWAAGDGAWLAPPPRLEHIDPRPGRLDLARRLAACAPFAADPAFGRAYSAAFRGDAAERRELEVELLGSRGRA